MPQLWQNFAQPPDVAIIVAVKLPFTISGVYQKIVQGKANCIKVYACSSDHLKKRLKAFTGIAYKQSHQVSFMIHSSSILPT
jgi:hypothetical protein